MNHAETRIQSSIAEIGVPGTLEELRNRTK